MKNIAKKNSFFDEVITDEDVSNRYKIIGQIGKGAFSIVSSAYDKLSNRHVAVKIYEKLNNLGWHRLENIKREIQNLQKLSH
jgi:serine/threonine protein kinase